MAFLMRRWWWALPVAALAVLVAYLPPQPPAERDFYHGEWQEYPTREARLAKRLGDDYLREAARAHALSLRDSLMRVLAVHPTRSGAVSTLTTPRFDRTARFIVRSALPPVPALSPDVKTVLALEPSGSSLGGWYTYLPTATDGRTCIASRSFEPSNQRLAVHFPSRALGPCAFFAAFGLPGREIQSWLAGHGYEFAWDPDWTRPIHSDFSEEQTTIGLWVESLVDRMTRSSAHYSSQTAWFYWHSFSESGCSAGRVDACRRFFFTEPSAPSFSPGVVQFRGFYYSTQEALLATLVREQGVDRFARFWRSPLPPEQAFNSAFTVPFAQWAPAWAKGAIGPVHADDVTRPGEIGSSVVWVGLCVGAVLGLALTRRVV